jgi:hypothetical protein
MKADKGRKFRAGGLKEVDSDSNPGLSKLPTEVRNKMGYMKKGGTAKESKMMVKKEVEFMKKKGAPASMIKHEKAEAGMKKGGAAHSDIAKDKPMMKKVAAKAVKGHEKRMHGMAKGGGIEVKGKTKGKMVKMKYGGSC